MTNKILVISAHPDDETYGVGGTIAKYAQNGDEVHIVIMTDGVTARHSITEPQKAAARKAGMILGAKEVHFANLPDQKLDHLPLTEVIDPIIKLVRQLQPNIVYTHHRGDANQDHRHIFEATMVAVRPFGNNPVEQVYCYEVASSTEWGPPFNEWAFLPNVYVDIKEFMTTKLAAVEAYRETHESEVKPYPHPRSPEAVDVFAQRHGINVGMTAAEAFMLVRSLVR